MKEAAADTCWSVSVKGVLIRAAHTVLLKNERNEWELPGGKLDHGESPDQRVVREIREDSGSRPTYRACSIHGSTRSARIALS
jgi:ADP-ribose pyrophosphatase YjhB (NUDIX family)